MLTRLRFKRDIRLFARYVTDAPSDNDGKGPDKKTDDHSRDTQAPKPASKKSSLVSSTEKIQALLKSMMTAEPKISDEEYRQRFTVAPDRRRRPQTETDEMEVKTEKIEESITRAAEDVAQALGGDVKQTEAELLSKVLGKINQTSTSLSDLLVGMKVDRTSESEGQDSRETRGQQVKRLADRSRADASRFPQHREQQHQPSDRPFARKSLPQPTTVNIYSGERLGIFKSMDSNPGTRLAVWESLEERELSLATAQPPANYFQKMILWTEQGKVWKFPIDNEQGMEEEQAIHFSEHIFLDQHLEGWCPRKGPIRHFMELVCVGLSKNPFYTVQEKRDHISWYREYFESKKDLLTEVGAWDTEKSASAEALT